jgi:hypothetical protein
MFNIIKLLQEIKAEQEQAKIRQLHIIEGLQILVGEKNEADLIKEKKEKDYFG